MSNDALKKLEKCALLYNDVIEKLEAEINNAYSLTEKERETKKTQLDAIERKIYDIKCKLKIISSKLYTKRAKTDKVINKKLKEKDSVEFNEVLLNQGKPARAILNLEKKAKKGEVEYQYLIGKTYLHGVIGSHGEIKMKDVGLGLKWLQVAYKGGIDDAGYLIALYEKSVLNVKRAILLLEKIGKNNHLKSLEELILIYKNDIKYQNFEKVLDIQQKIVNIENNR